MQHERTCRIERADGDASGLISGVLVTDGEASDGHILNIDGAQIPERAPLLFGHDDFTGTGNLGSWTSFEKFEGKRPGKSGIRGRAQIEMQGTGSQQAWRDDITHMIERGHIGQFSVRWDEIDGAEPVRRVNLPSDHPAFVDAEKATGRKRFGLFFDKWRLLEGSVVTLGADPGALIGRMNESQPDVRGYWRKTINRALTESVEVGGLVSLNVDGTEFLVERPAYDAMLEEANARLQLALDLYEQGERIYLTEPADDPITNPSSEQEREETPTELDLAESDAAPADQQEPTPRVSREPIDAASLVSLLGEALDENTQQLHAELGQMLDTARGKVVRT